MEEFSEISWLSEIIQKRVQAFDLKVQGNLEREKYIDTALNLFNYINCKDGEGVQKISRELEENNLEYDIDLLAENKAVNISGEDFTTYIHPVKDGALLMQSQEVTATEVVNMNKFKGTIVMQGEFEIMEAVLYNTHDEIIQKQFVNILPLGNIVPDAVFGEPEYIFEIKENALKNSEILAELSLPDFRPTIGVKNKVKIKRKYDKNSKDELEILPKFLKSMTLNPKKIAREMQDHKMVTDFNKALNYLISISTLDALTEALEGK